MNYWKKNYLIGVKKHGIQYQSFRVTDTTSKYGSCIPTKKTLQFTSRLILLPVPVVDAIIVHELCHMIYANHSKAFYELVKNYYPKYQEMNRWLKKNSGMIQF